MKNKAINEVWKLAIAGPTFQELNQLAQNEKKWNKWILQTATKKNKIP